MGRMDSTGRMGRMGSSGLSPSQPERLTPEQLEMYKRGLLDTPNKVVLNDNQKKAGNMMLNAFKKNVKKRKDKEKAAVSELVRARDSGKLKFGGKKQKTRKKRKGKYKRTRRFLRKKRSNSKTRRLHKTYRNKH